MNFNEKYSKKPELLAPAGDLEKLKAAVLYGADAVYIGGKNLSLRQRAKNFDDTEIEEGIKFAHKYGKKVYVAANIFAHNNDLEGTANYFQTLSANGADALIISDPGVFAIAREAVPDMEIHISTQANNTNYKSAEFWQKLGASRVVLARELSLSEICQIHKKLGDKMELEAFVHGAMCISYSGRCLLSSVMTGRDANRGACAHPCRYSYQIVEKTRQNEYYPIEEDERGTYIMNSKDLCMIAHIGDLINAGVISLKIEGRMKTPYYVATIVKAYREAIDDFYNDNEKYLLKLPHYMELIKKASYRDFTTAFFYNKPDENAQNYEEGGYIREYDFVGIVLSYDEVTGFAIIEQRNKFVLGAEIEILTPVGNGFTQKVEEMYNDSGDVIESAPHPKQIIRLKMMQKVHVFDMLRCCSKSQ